MFNDSGIVASINRIKNVLEYSLKNKYNIEDKDTIDFILKNHGLHKDNFDFIKNMEQMLSNNLADVSIDSNSNKNEKTMGGILAEITNPINKIIGYRYLYRVMKELYGKNEAKKLSGEMYDMSLAIADSTKLNLPYSYYKNTPILVKINNNIKYITFSNLYKMFKEKENINNDYYNINCENLYKSLEVSSIAIRNSKIKKDITEYNKWVSNEKVKEKINLEVWDNIGWVKIKNILRHENKKDFILYQISNGDFALVTEDHPVIMSDYSEKLASNLKIGETILKDENLPFFEETIDVPTNLAYIIGFMLGDGSYQCYDIDSEYYMPDFENRSIKFTRGGNLISIYQKDIDNSYILKILKETFPNANFFKVTDKSDRQINFSSPEFCYLLSIFFGINYKENSFTKQLPHNIMNWKKESKLALLSGLIDSDGNIFKHSGRIEIRMQSYSTINILYDLIRSLDFMFESIYKRIAGDNIDTLIFGVSFREKNNNLIKYSEKIKNLYNSGFIKKEYNDKHDTIKRDSKITKIIRFNRNNIKKTRFLYEELKEVYDITTETGTFYANGMKQHNCFAIDASKLVIEGRPFGQLPSKPPKRLYSYIAALNETIHQLSNHLAGACLYKNQNIIILENGVLKAIPIKSLIEKYNLNLSYNNFQGNWKYSNNVSDIKVLENKGNFVDIKKVMRRKYDKPIYFIKTKSGKQVKVSEDHIFKVLFKGRNLEIKAKDLKLYDTVYNTNFYDLPIDKESQDYKDGQFIGILCGDGNLTQLYSIRVSINYNQKFISDFLDSYLGENKGNLLDGHKCYSYTIYKKDFIDKIKLKINGDNCYNKNINIEDKSLNFLSGFLDGILVTDGGFNNSFTISLTNKILIENIKNILEKFNINLNYKIKPSKNNRKESYEITIPLFVKRYLQLTLKKYENHDFSKTKYINDKDIAYFSNSAFSHSKNIYTSSSCKTYKKREIEKYDPVTDVITSITQIENDDDYVYEIETESHWYSVGGLLTHNCAIGTFFYDTAHILIYKENKTLDEIKSNDDIRKYIENCYQNFVHSVNHLSRNAVESPFTNISLFDRFKLKTFLTPDNMGWYFSEQINNVEDNNKINYIIDYIIELQNIFMNFFDKGDIINNGKPFRFPVCTLNISKDTSNKENIKLLDKEFISEVCRHEIYRYNILVSEGSKVASCCFTENVKTYVKLSENDKPLLVSFGEIYNRSNNPFKTYLVYNGFDYVPARLVILPYSDYLYNFYSDDAFNDEDKDYSDIQFTYNHIHCVKINNKEKELTSEQLFLLEKDREEILIKFKDKYKKRHIKKSEKIFNGFVYCWGMVNEKHPYFMLENGIITHNCRLLSDSDMLELGGQSNSFGGTSISLGSHRVVTINFNRIALESKSYDEYFKILDSRIEDASKILIAHRQLLKDSINNGLQFFMKNNTLKLDRMFSTFGVLGLYEANRTMKEKTLEDKDLIKESLIYLNNKVKELSVKNKTIYNIEAIPGESMAVKLCDIDKKLFSKEKVNYELYANQFVPLWEDVSLWERMDVDGKYNKLFTGGGICHFGLGEKVTSKQAQKIIEYAVKSGCEHFALNSVYSECENKHTNFGNLEVCPDCGQKIIEKYSRICGFFTQISSWNKVRREWELPKRKFSIIN